MALYLEHQPNTVPDIDGPDAQSLRHTSVLASRQQEVVNSNVSDPYSFDTDPDTDSAFRLDTDPDPGF